MSHRIMPEEAEGLHIPTFWEEAAEAFMELDTEVTVPEPGEIRLADSILQAA